MLITPKQVERWAGRFELNLFYRAGRGRNLLIRLKRWPGARHFRSRGDDGRRDAEETAPGWAAEDIGRT